MAGIAEDKTGTTASPLPQTISDGPSLQQTMTPPGMSPPNGQLQQVDEPVISANTVLTPPSEEKEALPSNANCDQCIEVKGKASLLVSNNFDQPLPSVSKQLFRESKVEGPISNGDCDQQATSPLQDVEGAVGGAEGEVQATPMNSEQQVKAAPSPLTPAQQDEGGRSQRKRSHSQCDEDIKRFKAEDGKDAQDVQESTSSCVDDTATQIVKSSLLPEERVHLKQDFAEGLKSVEAEFQTYFNAVKNSVRRMGISFDSFLLYVLTLPCYEQEDGTDKPKLLTHKQEKFEKAKSTDDVFAVLAECCNFMEFCVLKEIIKKFSLDVGTCSSYPQHLDEFLKSFEISRFFDISLAPPDQPGTTRLVLVLDIEKMKKFSKLVDIKKAVARNLGLDVSTLVICNISEGSVIVNCRLHAELARDVFCGDDIFTNKQVKVFRSLSMKKMECNGYFYDFMESQVSECEPALPIQTGDQLTEVTAGLSTEPLVDNPIAATIQGNAPPMPSGNKSPSFCPPEEAIFRSGSTWPFGADTSTNTTHFDLVFVRPSPPKFSSSVSGRGTLKRDRIQSKSLYCYFNKYSLAEVFKEESGGSTWPFSAESQYGIPRVLVSTFQFSQHRGGKSMLQSLYYEASVAGCSGT